MNTKILFSLLALTIIAGCKKNAFTTKPQLEYKSVNTTVLSRNQLIKFIIEVRDLEGDIQDTIWIRKVEPKCVNSNFTAKYKMPDFTATRNFKGDVEVCFGYGLNLGCPTLTGPACSNRNDTATFRFWIKDKAGNRSDTISSPQIVILR